MDATFTEQIDWTSTGTHLRVNPRLDDEAQAQTRRLFADAPSLAGHVWVQSSGSTASKDESAKWIALSKKAFLVSAEAVNQHLAAQASDVWGLCLPSFHVGGLSIRARCFLTGSRCLEFLAPWEPAVFAGFLNEKKISLLSLVPTQLYDLVAGNFAPPRSLRAVVLGGARLEPALYEKASQAGWPVLPSFGMTEFCSQVATARPGSPDLILLSHMQARIDAQETLFLKSDSLFTGFLQERRGKIHWETPILENGFWKTPDRAFLRNEVLQPLGRTGDYVKIKGEGVHLGELRSRFEAWLVSAFPLASPGDFALTALPDKRDGHRLVLAFEKDSPLPKGLVEAWNAKCFPPERLEACEIASIPRSPLGKVLWGALNDGLAGR